MSPVSGSKVFAAQGCSPQSSSLRKTPRYFTEGGPMRRVPAATKSSRLRTGATSARHDQPHTHAGQGVFDRGDQETLPVPAQTLGVDLPLARELVDEGALAERP